MTTNGDRDKSWREGIRKRLERYAASNQNSLAGIARDTGIGYRQSLSAFLRDGTLGADNLKALEEWLDSAEAEPTPPSPEDAKAEAYIEHILADLSVVAATLKLEGTPPHSRLNVAYQSLEGLVEELRRRKEGTRSDRSTEPSRG